MEVRPGYKHTEVGVIPEEWDVSTVGREFEIKLGKMLDAEKNVGVPKPYLGNKAVQWDRIDMGDLPTVPMSRADIERFRLRKGDLLVCEGGEVGRAAIWDAPIQECYYQKALHRLRPLRGFDSRLMIALLRQWSERGLLANYVTQTSIAHLPREKFVEVPMPVPTPAEQRAIATTLSDADALLSKLDQIIAKKRDIKQATMQQLLTGKTRLPGFSGEWETTTLGEVASVSKGTQLYSSETNLSGKFAHLNGGITPSGYTHKSNTPTHTIAISEGGNSCGYVQFMTEPYWCGGHCYSVIPNGIENRFLYHALKGQQSAIMGLRVGSGLPNVQKTALLAFKLRYPATEGEQTAIASILSDMDAEIAALAARRDKTRDLKKGMMQELLTGRIRFIHSIKVENTDKKQRESAQAGHNWAINEAVVISVLTAKFGSEKFPLGRMRYTKLSYLMHRHEEKQAEGYLKKAAGPYNPETRYKGPETIAQKNRYIEAAQSGKLSGFIAARNIDQALDYFNKWYGREVLEWLEQFRYDKNEFLELLTTVDMATEDLRANGREITVEAVKEVLRVHPEWQPKLKREIFSDVHIKQAITRCRELFGVG